MGELCQSPPCYCTHSQKNGIYSSRLELWKKANNEKKKLAYPSNILAYYWLKLEPFFRSVISPCHTNLTVQNRQTQMFVWCATAVCICLRMLGDVWPHSRCSIFVCLCLMNFWPVCLFFRHISIATLLKVTIHSTVEMQSLQLVF